MRSHRPILLCCLALSALLALAAPLYAAQAPAAQASSLGPEPTQQFVLNMSGVYPGWHPIMREVIRPWAEALMEKTEGRLVIRNFEPGSITHTDVLARSVRLGQSNMGIGVLNTEAEEFGFALLAAQGQGSLKLRELSAAYWRMFTEIPELAEEFKGIKLLAVYAGGPYQFCMVRHLPYTAESLAGRRFLVDSPIRARFLDDFGASATVLPQTDFKMYMDDKIADGVVFALCDLSRLGIQGYITGVSLGDLGNGVIWLGMHQGDWDMLPQDLKRIVTQSSGLGLSQTLGEMEEKNYRAELDKLRSGPVKLHYFSAEERKKFYGAGEQIRQTEWQLLCRERGYNAKQLQDKIDKILADTKAR